MVGLRNTTLCEPVGIIRIRAHEGITGKSYQNVPIGPGIVLSSPSTYLPLVIFTISGKS